jgi:SOUL heme-binding protein
MAWLLTHAHFSAKPHKVWDEHCCLKICIWCVHGAYLVESLGMKRTLITLVLCSMTACATQNDATSSSAVATTAPSSNATAVPASVTTTTTTSTMSNANPTTTTNTTTTTTTNPTANVTTNAWPLRAPTSGSAVRLSGDAPIPEEVKEGWVCGDYEIEAPLPVGYAPPTPPRCMEIKSYPLVRRAEITSTGKTNAGANRSFWPLFQHIQKRGIAMTSPVEMDYTGMSDDKGNLSDERGSWTMSFLYRTPDMGETGPAESNVQVKDLPPMTVISLGMQGNYGLKQVNTALDKLRDALAKQDQWVVAGEPRALNYNGPQIEAGYRWSEIQIPVKPSMR